MVIINQTTAYCKTCEASHSAVIESVGNRVVARIACPKEEQLIHISSEPDMFLNIRSKSNIDLSKNPKKNSCGLVNFMDITNACNCKCPVCGVSSGEHKDLWYLSPDEVYQRAKELKQRNGRNLMLLGGEPTVHPGLEEILQKIKPLGLRVSIASNGYKLAADKDYAARLKESGLWKVALQFDTFNEEVHEKIRGNRHIDKKLRAMNNIINVGLRLGITATVTSLNLPELGEIIKHALNLSPNLSTIVFQGACPTGRFLLSEEVLVDRDQIIKSVLNSNVFDGVSMEDIQPLPSFKPWQLQLHPDCAANLIMVLNGTTIEPLRNYVNIDRLYDKLSANGMKPSWFSKNIVPLYYILKNAKLGKRIELLKCIKGFLSGSTGCGFLIVGFGSYWQAQFQDEQKLARCASRLLTSSGFICPCSYKTDSNNEEGTAQ